MITVIDAAEEITLRHHAVAVADQHLPDEVAPRREPPLDAAAPAVFLLTELRLDLSAADDADLLRDPEIEREVGAARRLRRAVEVFTVGLALEPVAMLPARVFA